MKEFPTLHNTTLETPAKLEQTPKTHMMFEEIKKTNQTYSQATTQPPIKNIPVPIQPQQLSSRKRKYYIESDLLETFPTSNKKEKKSIIVNLQRPTLNQYFKARRSRISSIRNRSSLNLTRKELVKYFRTSTKSLILAPIWQRLQFKSLTDTDQQQ